MKKSNLYFMCAILFLVAVAFTYSQEDPVDRATVPFSNPSQPGFVKASVYHGGITVRGYDGKEVVVEARARGKILSDLEQEISEKVRETILSEAQRKKISEKVKGMRRIQVVTTGLTIEEEDNVMRVGVESYKRTVDLTIQVPYSTSLKLKSYRDGDIIVENVNGEIEVEHYKGEVKITDISGSVVAYTYSGNIMVTFTKVAPEKPMSFSNYRGDIDVTFPADTPADLKMKSERGEIYSDFDISIKQTPQKVASDSQRKKGKYRISFEKYIHGSINGGGPEFHFKTYRGDILIRKAK